MAAHPKMYMYKRVVEAKLYMEKHYAEPIDLNNISNQANFSKYHFLRLFKRSFGTSPHKYLTQIRLEKAKILLQQNIPVGEVCFQVGFESIPSFIHLFKKKENITPYEYTKRHIRVEKEKTNTPLSFVHHCFAQGFNLE